MTSEDAEGPRTGPFAPRIAIGAKLLGDGWTWRARSFRHEFRECPDDLIGNHRSGFGKTSSGTVHPDAAQAQALRRGDVPLEVVSDHPRVRGTQAERGEDVSIDGLLRLADAELALDDDDIEIALERVLL